MDLTLLGGRHRWRHIAQAGTVDLHPIADRLICATIHDGTSGWPAVIRDCPCGNQLWVSTAMLDSVDARRIFAICLGCHLTDRKPLELPQAVMPALHLSGCSADAWRVVAHLNGLEFDRGRLHRATVPSGSTEHGHRHTRGNDTAIKRAGA